MEQKGAPWKKGVKHIEEHFRASGKKSELEWRRGENWGHEGCEKRRGGSIWDHTCFLTCVFQAHVCEQDFWVRHRMLPLIKDPLKTLHHLLVQLTMNKSLSSKSTARRKAFSKRWYLQRRCILLKRQTNKKLYEKTMHVKVCFLGLFLLLLCIQNDATHLQTPLHTKLSIIEQRAVSRLPIIQN